MKDTTAEQRTVRHFIEQLLAEVAVFCSIHGNAFCKPVLWCRCKEKLADFGDVAAIKAAFAHLEKVERKIGQNVEREEEQERAKLEAWKKDMDDRRKAKGLPLPSGPVQEHHGQPSRPNRSKHLSGAMFNIS